MPSATGSRCWPTRRSLRSERSRNYWLWIILGYKSISMVLGGALRPTAMKKGSWPSGDPVELCDGWRGDGGPARRHVVLHRLARRALEQGDQMLRYLFQPGGGRAQQGLERHLLGRPRRPGEQDFAAPQPARIRVGADRGR